MATEKNLVEFRKSHPIDFKLLDQDEQAVLYISEDKDDWKLHLTIANTSSQAITMITMVDGQGGVSSDNHHFALLFRPGTLSKRTLDLLGSDDYARVSRTADWEIARIGRPATNETESNKPVTLFLLYGGANKTLAVGETRTIEFSGISAAPGSGSRGTQVELVPHQLQFASDNTSITASRTQYMHVTNHSGRKNIPLHVGIVDGNRVLNGATDATITLRITNGSRTKSSAITFRKKDAKEPTKLTVSYDKGDDNWMLATSKASVVASYTNEAGEKRTVYGRDPVGAQGESPDQEITFDDDFSLEYGRSIDITVENLVVSSTAGQANVYLHYENIPGYWDGQFVCSVEKGPIVVKDGNVGIGGVDKDAKLNVVGSTKLHVDKKQFLFLRDVPSNYGGGIHVFTTNSRLLVAQNFEKGQPVPLPEIHLVADKVGIGTTAPSAKLEIGGDVKMSFGPGAEGLHFMRNNNGNPGIFVTGTYGANAGLTIAKVDKGDKGDTYGGNIPKIMLNTDELVVTGSLKVNTIEAKDSGPLIIKGARIKGAQQFVGNRKLWNNDKGGKYGNDWETIDVPVYNLFGPPTQQGATRQCRFYIIAYDNWDPNANESGKGTYVRQTYRDNTTFDVFISSVWGNSDYKRRGQQYSNFFTPKVKPWIESISVRSATGTESDKADLYELWVEFWDFFE